jgi:uracil-DNA glycosylase family 4
VFDSSGATQINRLLRLNGARGDEVHYTNAILCGARLKDLKEARKCCEPRLQLELAAVAPAAVIALDSLATQSTLASPRPTAISKYRGSVNKLGEMLVLPVMHPAEVRNNPKWRPTFEIDIARAVRLVRDGWTTPEEADGRRIIVCDTIDALAMGLESLRSSAAIGFDVETVGLGPTETSLVCYGVGDSRTAVVVPWASRDGRYQHWADGGREAARLTSELLLPRVMVTHNGPAFDHIIAARYGISFGKWDDTLLMSHAKAGHLPKNLAHVVTQVADVPPWKTLDDRKAEMARLHYYCGRDVLFMQIAYEAMKDK